MSQDENEGGFAVHHPTRRALPMYVAPTTTGRELNARREPLVAVACWSLGDLRFDFDSSFVKPEVRTETALLAQAIRVHAGGGKNPTMTIFGHADPVGKDEYNKQLSGRRAASVYGLLTRDVGLWEHLYKKPFGADVWGDAHLVQMLSASGYAGGSAARDFQRGHGLVVDGVVGPKTRAALFAAYMDSVALDDTGQPFRVDRADFLLGGVDPGGRGDYQGCGEHNPSLLLSSTEAATLSKPERDAENTPNRRVIAFLFRPGTHATPEEWPCPRADEGPEGCRRRFFSDAPRRLAVGSARREYKASKDTFACRFYDRLAVRSPCEGLRHERILEITFDDPFLGPAGGVSVDVAFSGGARESLVTTSAGAIFVEASKGEHADMSYERRGVVQKRRFFLDPPSASTDDGAWQRLVNLGYVFEPEVPASSPPGPATLRRAVQSFQADFRLPVTGSLDGAARSRLDEAHESRVPWRQRAWVDEPAPGPSDTNHKGTLT